MFSKAFFKAAFVRMIRTCAQAGIAMIGTSAVILSDVNWIHVISAMGLSGLISLLMAFAGLPEVEQG